MKGFATFTLFAASLGFVGEIFVQELDGLDSFLMFVVILGHDMRVYDCGSFRDGHVV